MRTSEPIDVDRGCVILEHPAEKSGVDQLTAGIQFQDERIGLPAVCGLESIERRESPTKMSIP